MTFPNLFHILMNFFFTGWRQGSNCDTLPNIAKKMKKPKKMPPLSERLVTKYYMENYFLSLYRTYVTVLSFSTFSPLIFW